MNVQHPARTPSAERQTTTVGLLLLTHGGIAAALRTEAQRILPQIGTVAILSVAADDSCEQLRDRLQAIIDQLDNGAGVLVLADLEGATPCNQVTQLLHHPDYHQRVQLVTGLNLPMLLKVLNYRQRSLSHLTELAISGGTAGIHQGYNR